MDVIKQIENIDRCTVRLSDESGEILFGSGLLFLAIENQNAFVFTAAHVIDNINISHIGQEKRIKIALKNSKDEVKTIDLDCRIKSSDKIDVNVGDIYIHSDYTKGKFVNDVAIVCIPQKDWMSGLKTYSIDDCTICDSQIGFGFPESSDNEADDSGNNTILDGKSKLEGKVVTKHDSRYVFEYNNKVVYNAEISRSQIMNGYSGTGLFSLKNDRYKLCGIVSSPYGKEGAGNQAYANNANLLFDIMEQLNLKVDIPKTFNLHRDLIKKEYNAKLGYEMERNIFDFFAEDLISNFGLTPQSVFEDGYEEIKCKQQKNSCNEYWIGQLKKSVILAKLKNVSVENLNSPYIKMPEPYSEYEVGIKFLCSDEAFATVVRNLIEFDYFNNGSVNNNTIFLWNSHSDNNDNITKYTREKFRSAMISIVGSKRDKYTFHEMAKKLAGVIEPNEGMVTFDIITGDINQCNLALLSTNRMMESIEDLSDEQNVEEMQDKFDEKLREIWRAKNE